MLVLFRHFFLGLLLLVGDRQRRERLLCLQSLGAAFFVVVVVVGIIVDVESFGRGVIRIPGSEMRMDYKQVSIQVYSVVRFQDN